MTKTKKIILLFSIVICFSGMLYSADFAFADKNLEIEYPTIPAADTPGTDSDKLTTLPQYIKYLFNFGIAIGGILTFLVLVYGGFLWMTSAGDPTAIGKAKTKMFSGIIGLCLLLGAFLIIGMIDPDLKHLKDVPDMLAKSGVYLCETEADCEIKDPNKRKRYQGNIPKFPGDLDDPDAFHAKKACFISKKNELMSIFIHEEENYKGNIEKEIENTKEKDEDQVCGDISGGKSLSFLWNNSGVYLYQKPEFEVEGTDKTPKYLRGGGKVLKKWDNITESIKIVHPDINTIILGILFNEPDYSGRCAGLFDGHSDWDARKAGDPPILITEIKNLDDATDGKSKIKGDISSIYTFTYDGKSPKGEVKFFDEQNCDGNSFTEEMPENALMTPVFFDGKTFSDDSDAEGRVLSFAINGPYVVMIKTRKGYDDDDLQCKIFTKPNASNCYDSIVTSNVYSENNDEIRPRMCYIIPSN